MDFMAIGDTAVDEFIRLEEGHPDCTINKNDCTICMKWGDKIPYEFSVLVAGTGNAANAAVAAARLGLSAGLISNVGDDRFGEETLASLAREKVDGAHVAVNAGVPTNHHYVLWYGAERTILVRHEEYPYRIPAELAAPKWIYLSSAGEHSSGMHDELAAWIAQHPETKLAFQPGTFQILLGKEKLAPLYTAAEVVACNKEEAERILEIGETDVKTLLEKMRSLGPKIVLITDGPNGAYVYDGAEMVRVPMYPDPKPPYERTGAGDAMTSTFVAALALGHSVADAMLWGPINSMSVVQAVGSQKGLLTREQIQEYLAKAPAEYRVEPL
ncbi:MAG: carbohydrate kinase family protein [Minisyncoccia bacterium]